jgi:hypothetical protein
MKAKIQKDLDLEDEDFITDEELMGYGNDGLKDAHKIYVKNYETCLETEASLALVSGTSVYDLPTDIYANKITHIQYSDGSNKFTIRELKDKKQIPYVVDSDDYRYRIVNSTASGAQLKLYPAAQETSASNVTIHYIRTVKQIADDDDDVDLPEAAEYIIQHIKDSCRNKEAGTLYSAPPSPALEKQEMSLMEVLSDMTPDGDNVMPGDFSFYDEFDSDLGEL